MSNRKPKGLKDINHVFLHFELMDRAATMETIWHGVITGHGALALNKQLREEAAVISEKLRAFYSNASNVYFQADEESKGKPK